MIITLFFLSMNFYIFFKRHFSSFADKHKKFNLAQLFCEKIKIELSCKNDYNEEQFYTNSLHKIVLKYDIDINIDRSMENNLTNKINNRKVRNKKNKSKNNDNYNDGTDNTHIVEDDDSYEDVNSDDSIYSVTIVDSNDGNNNDNCCCRIM